MKFNGFKYPEFDQQGNRIKYTFTFTPTKKSGIQGYRLDLNGEYSPTIRKYTDAVLTWMRTNTLVKRGGVFPDKVECRIVVVLG